MPIGVGTHRLSFFRLLTEHGHVPARWANESALKRSTAAIDPFAAQLPD